MQIFSRYNLVARVFPAIIGLIPMYIFLYAFLDGALNIKSILALVVGDATLSTIFVFAISQYLVRIPSKVFEDFLFGKQMYFPTTTLLMHSDDELSNEYKRKIREAINADFSIRLPNKMLERRDEDAARRRINEAVGLIISKVKDGHLILQHNLEYGFARNLWGASVIGVIGSLLLIVHPISRSAQVNVGIVLMILYGLYLCLGFILMKYLGSIYAKRIIQEYYNLYYEK